ncbi:Trypsin [Popillia japonica]|uniref:Trypsin n=1 Tax=Popillia japonica TaxID=7064 RepID=A0AAW1LSK2_POPJA
MAVLKLLVYLSTLLLVVRADDDQSDVPGVMPTDAPEDEEAKSEPVLSAEEAPFLVSLTHNGYQYCSAACIDKQWILTSAHCIKSEWSDTTTIFFGTTECNVSQTSRTIARSVEHPIEPVKPESTTFNASSETLNNIALIELNEPIEPSKSIDIIEIEKSDGSFVKSISSCFGYGKLCEDENDTIDARHVAFTIAKVDGEDENDTIDARHVAFTIAKVDDYVIFRDGDLAGPNIPCKCDSGGPVVLNKKLIAITVCGQQCQHTQLTNTILRVTPFVFK